MDGRIVTTVVDVRDSMAIEQWVKTCFDEEERLDGGANCAGVNGVTKVTTVVTTVALHGSQVND